jgi:hypothetical protein
MPIYTEYLNQNLDPHNFAEERQRQLSRISELRGRDVLVYAASMRSLPGHHSALTTILYEDLLSIDDQLSALKGTELDLLIESPGGSGEVAEDIVKLIRRKYRNFAVIVPGWAKSAATIIAMAASEILMGRLSALGPIDAQLQWQGKVFSADALLEGLEKIKREVLETGSLNKAYIPILQNISPGEIQAAENALTFAQKLVREWLAEYKFAPWTNHSSTGLPVTDEDRRSRAAEIAKKLADHRFWLTHGRSIRIDDLRAMKVQVTDYSEIPDLDDAISRYYTLLQMTFETNIYKLFETPASQIAKIIIAQAAFPQQSAPQQGAVSLDVQCNNCGAVTKVQANIGVSQPLQPGTVQFPPDSKLRCPRCGNEINLESARKEIEQKLGPIV